ncbi:hypothetical protein PFISCL1PPCAC_14920, partial [Pristionchus fissidentatus]
AEEPIKDCVPPTKTCDKNVTVPNGEVIITCTQDGKDCKANVTCKDGYVMESQETKNTNILFICDVLNKTWIDSDTKLTLGEGNKSAICVP